MKSTQKVLEYQKQYRAQNKDLIRQKAKNKRHRRIIAAVNLLGNKCQSCNHTYDIICYDFHHINPQDKLFNISENMDTSEEKFFNEVKKCILLCANCHRLIHKKEDTLGKRKV